jgi:hypothetical protein
VRDRNFREQSRFYVATHTVLEFYSNRAEKAEILSSSKTLLRERFAAAQSPELLKCRRPVDGRLTPGLHRRRDSLFMRLLFSKNGSGGSIRTCDSLVNSQVPHHLATRNKCLDSQPNRPDFGFKILRRVRLRRFGLD